MKKMLRTAGVLLLAFVLLICAACGGKETPGDQKNGSKAESVKPTDPKDSEKSGTESAESKGSAEPASSAGDGYEWPVDPEYTYETNGPDVIALRNMLATSPVVEIPLSVDGKKVNGLYQFAIRNGEHVDEVIIPEGIETMIDSGFSSCDNLKKITIPASVTQIADSATNPNKDDEFWFDLAHVEDVVITKGNPVYERDGGIIYRKNKDGSRTIVWYCRSNPEESYTVPDDIGVGAAAFAYTDHLKTLNTPVFPQSLIGSGIEVINYAPHDSGYIKIDIDPDDTALREVNIRGAFNSDLYSGTGLQNATRLERVTMVENKESISIDGVIYSLNDTGEPSALTLYPPARKGETYEVPDTVTKIGPGAFSGDELPYLKTLSLKRGCSTDKAKIRKLTVIYRD